MRGATVDVRQEVIKTIISTHTPHAGRDGIPTSGPFWGLGFLLTRPMRGATRLAFATQALYEISTHTPHAGRDETGSGTSSGTSYFYSHAPCGARPSSLVSPSTVITFLLTRPMRGATTGNPWCLPPYEISTHTPHAGRDPFII